MASPIMDYVRKCGANKPFPPQVVSDHGVYHSDRKQTRAPLTLAAAMTCASYYTIVSRTPRNVLYQQNGLQATALTENPLFPPNREEKIKIAFLILNLTILIFPPLNSSLSLQVN